MRGPTFTPHFLVKELVTYERIEKAVTNMLYGCNLHYFNWDNDILWDMTMLNHRMISKCPKNHCKYDYHLGVKGP